MKARGLLKELIENADEPIRFHKIDLENSIIMAFGDSSWANAKNHKSQSAFIVYHAEKSCLTEDGGIANLMDTSRTG